MNTKNILLIVVFVLLIDILIAKANKIPNILIKKRLPFNYNAQTIPPFGIVLLEKEKDNEMLLRHELVHWLQYQKTGAIIFYLKYVLQKAFYGYDKMPMEIEARKLSEEKTNCLTNYTSCVRDGLANTVINKNFRTCE